MKGAYKGWRDELWWWLFSTEVVDELIEGERNMTCGNLVNQTVFDKKVEGCCITVWLIWKRLVFYFIIIIMIIMLLPNCHCCLYFLCLKVESVYAQSSQKKSSTFSSLDNYRSRYCLNSQLLLLRGSSHVS